MIPPDVLLRRRWQTLQATMPWPSLSLPSNMQNRVLSYVLRRAVGRFVKAGLDVDEVQAQLAQGAVELDGLELDPQGINDLLIGIPLTVTGGTVDHVTAQIAGWALGITVQRLELELTLGGSVDLAQSFAAQEDLVESLTDTLAQSLADVELNAPGAFPTDTPSQDDSSVLAGLVEQLLSRLGVNINTLIIHVSHDVEYTIRVDKVTYDHGVTISGITVRMEDTSDSDGSVGYTDMLMSQAVGDIRESSATVYASAHASTFQPLDPPVLEIAQVKLGDGRVDISHVKGLIQVWHLEALVQAARILRPAGTVKAAGDPRDSKDIKSTEINLDTLQISLVYQAGATLDFAIEDLKFGGQMSIADVAVNDHFNDIRSVIAFSSSPAIAIDDTITLAPSSINVDLSLISRLLPLRHIFDPILAPSTPNTQSTPPTPTKAIRAPSISISIIPLHSTTLTICITDLAFDGMTISLDSSSVSCGTTFLHINDILFHLDKNICRIPSARSTLDRPTIEALQFLADDVSHWLASTKKSQQAPSAEGKTSNSIRVVLDNVDVTLLVPSETGSRTVGVRAGIIADLGPTIHLAINDLEVEELTPILQGAIELRFGSSAARETSIGLALIGLNINVTTDVSLAQDMAKFIKAPEGAFVDVVPSEVTHVNVRIDDSSVVAILPSGQLKMVIHSATAKTDITAGDDIITATADLDIYAAESEDFAQLITATFDARLEKGDVTKLDVPNLRFRMAACADSFASLSSLVGDISSSLPRSPLPPPPPPAAPIDVFASVDEDAFRAAPHIGAGADMIDDDLPTHGEYLDGSTSADTVRILYDAPFILEDYWHNLEPAESSSGGQLQVRIACEGEVLLHEGYDWASTRQAIEEETQAVRKRLGKIKELLAAGQTPDPSMEQASILFNSIYIDPDDAWESFETETQDDAIAPPKRLRSKRPLIEIALRGGDVSLDSHDSGETASRLHCAMQSVDILDHIKTSTWKTFLTEKRGGVRETGADMIRVELLKVRLAAEEEARLKVKILPLRLHVDQDALDFLKRFFGFRQGGDSSSVFFQHVEIYPVELKLDYKPKRVDLAALREGRTIELMNFFHFDGAEMTLRHVTLSGINGSELASTLSDLWTPDVKAHQLADVISGVSPIRSMVNVGSGVADLILLPLEQYRKDGRVARGVQRGTTSFMRTTAMEGLKLGARLATGTQVVLERAEMVLGGRAVELDSDAISRYAHQPQDAREGIEAAYRSLAVNVNSAAQTILAVPMEVYDENSSVRAVVRAVPIAVLKPMIGASEAVSKTLLGLRNGMSPEARLEQEEKYKR